MSDYTVTQSLHLCSSLRDSSILIIWFYVIYYIAFFISNIPFRGMTSTESQCLFHQEKLWILLRSQHKYQHVTGEVTIPHKNCPTITNIQENSIYCQFTTKESDLQNLTEILYHSQDFPIYTYGETRKAFKSLYASTQATMYFLNQPKMKFKVETPSMAGIDYITQVA